MKKRWISACLAAILLCGMTGCAGQTKPEQSAPAESTVVQEEPDTPATPTEQKTPSRQEAYQALVQSLVDRYGIFTDEKSDAWMMGDQTISGLLDAVSVDVTGDGEDELACVWANGYHFTLAIYTYADGKVTKDWTEQFESGGYFFLGMYQAGDAVCWSASITRHFPIDLFTYRDGKYQSASEQGELSEQQQEKIAEAGRESGLMGESDAMLAAYREQLGLPEYSSDDMIFSVHADLGLHSAEDLVDRWQIKLPKEIVSAQDVLQDMAYFGDRSKCKMDAKMAQAYADAIDSMNMQEGEFSLYATLADPADDGMPILLTAYLDKNVNSEAVSECSDTRYGEIGYIPTGDETFIEPIVFWQYDGSKAQKMDIEVTNYTTGFGTMDGQAAYRYIQFYHDAGHNVRAQYYTIQNGQMTLAHTVEFLDIVKEPSGDGKIKLYGDVPDGADYQPDDEQALREHGWVDDDPSWWLVLDNGENISQKVERATWNHDTVTHFEETQELAHINDIEYHYMLDSTLAEDSVALLRAYADAEGRPVYTFPEVSHRFDSEQLNQLTDLFADTVTGEIGEIYQLSDDLYYIILYTDGKVSGYATVKQTLQGFRLVSQDTEPTSEDALHTLVQQDQQTSNITLDYNESGEDKAAYLTEALQNIDGTAVNDAAKGEIAAYIENAVAESSVTDVPCRGNTATIDGDVITQSLEQAQAQKDALDQTLDGVTLNKTVNILLRMVCTGLEDGKPVQVTFDPSMIEAMADAQAVQVMLGDAQHSVAVDADALAQLCEKHGKLIVQVQLQDGKYTISLLDGEQNQLDQLESSLTFTLPAESETATVLASYEGGSDNWGGQFDAINQTIEFSTPYSGTYEVMENAAEIADIADCDEQTAAAIRFMVSKGYFSLDDAGNFDPNGTLNRYMFAEALVRMFFALDRNLTTSFTDVPQDSPYYPYVASGEQDAIIEGFEDNTFRGENDVLREEVIALCSRTLADKKGYSYPTDVAAYLTFTDADTISDWARDTTALAVRETLISGTGTLAPQQSISRGEAALLLYRLFMLLYEPPVAEMHFDGFDDTTSSGLPTVAIALAGVGLLGGGAAGVVYRRKKRAPMPPKDDNPSDDEPSE